VGKVTDHVLGLVRRRLSETGPVVWFDPDRAYSALPERLRSDGLEVVEYEDSFLLLRHQVDKFMAGFEPPRLVIYVPMDESATEDALIEFTAAGLVLKPGGHSSSNTRLAVVARAALKGAVPEDSLDAIVRRVEAGQLTLQELDDLAERGGPDLSALAVVYGTSQPQEIVLRFLCDPSKDEALVEKGGLEELTQLANSEYSIPLGTPPDVDGLRARLANAVLILDCALSAGLARKIAVGLSVPEAPIQREAVRELARVWRNRQDFGQAYLDRATESEKVIDVEAIRGELQRLRAVETFAVTEDALQRTVCDELIQDARPEFAELAASRVHSFWGRQPQFAERWRVIRSAAELLAECERVSNELSDHLDADSMAGFYAYGDRPWCVLDTIQRRMERDYLSLDDIVEIPELEKLVSRARQRYHETANLMADRFVSSMERANFRLKLQRQRDTFARVVRPLLGEGRVAYFLVDAMRFEMGRELARLLDAEGEVSLAPAVASVPTITEIGMASLMPEADGDVVIAAAGPSKLALVVEGVTLPDRKARMDFLSSRATVPASVLKLEDFPLNRTRREAIREAKLVVVTSQEIDMVGEADNTAFARQTMLQALDMIVRAVRALVREGIYQFVVSADHGHLFGEETLGDMTIENPRGDVADLHRRVWVGRGGAAVPNTVRFKTTAFDLTSEYDIVTPRTLACFKAAGGNAFFHGGISLQELIIPVLTLKATPKSPARPKSITWRLSGSRKLTTRVYSVEVAGETGELFGLEPPIVKVGAFVGNKAVGRVQDADYGLETETKDVTLRATPTGRAIESNHVTLVFDELGDAKQLEIRLDDARSSVTLAKMTVEVAIAL
jgi:hypothetical protein